MNAIQHTGIYTAISLVLLNSHAVQAELEEVVVTAQKRSQSVQEVPIAITSIQGDDLRKFGFKSASDIQYQTPGLVVSYSSTSAVPNFSLRGVGLNDFTAIQSSPVAIHVDDVYYGNSTLLNFALFDIDRVEVLKGPQGTLYGRNSTGGAVNFFSNRPSQEFEAGVDIGLANYQNRTVTAFVSGGLSDSVSARLSATTTQQDSGPYKHNVYGRLGEQDKYAVRGQILWQASDELTIHASVFGGRDESDANQYHGSPAFTNDGSLSICGPISQGSLSASAECSFDGSGAVQAQDNDPFTVESGLVNRDEIEAFGGSLSISYETDDYSINAITGINQSERKSQEDADGSAARNVDVGYETDFQQVTQELRFNFGNEDWNSTLGLFLSHDELDAPRTETDLSDLYAGFRQNHAYELTTDSAAIFSHTEFNLSEETALIVGLRYTKETRDFKGGTIDVAAGQGPDSQGNFQASPGPLPGDYSNAAIFSSAYLDDSIDFGKASWRFGVNHYLNQDTMIYASVSNGFKSGGFVGDITLTDILAQPYSEETLTAYEIGIKADLFDNTVRWNTSFFHYDYQDIILALTITDNPALDLLLINDNGADADITGLESDIWWAASEGLDIKLAFTYLDSEQSGLKTEPFQVAEQLDGSELPYAPKLSANGSIRYSQPVTGSWLASVQLDFTSRSHHFGEAQNSVISRIAGYTLFNARASIESDDGQWSSSLWVKNLGDKLYYQYVNDLQGLGSVIRTPGMPRTYGLEVSYRF